MREAGSGEGDVDQDAVAAKVSAHTVNNRGEVPFKIVLNLYPYIRQLLDVAVPGAGHGLS